MLSPGDADKSPRNKDTASVNCTDMSTTSSTLYQSQGDASNNGADMRSSPTTSLLDGQSDSGNDLVDSDEIGFLFLQDCAISFQSKIQRGVWMDVCLTKPCQTNNHENKSKQGACNVEKTGADALCRRCNLVLNSTPIRANARLDPEPLSPLLPQSNESDGHSNSAWDKSCRLELNTKETPRFSSMINDTRCQNTKDKKHATTRSDASMLVGLVLLCQDYGHIEIRKVQVMVHPPKQTRTKKSTNQSRDDVTNVKNDSCQTSHRACLLITVAMPYLMNTQHEDSASEPLSNKRNTSTGRKRKPTKILPPCTQLLLAIIRSDWNRLYRQMQDATSVHVDNNKYQGTPMFPSALSLEELYLRLHGASRHHVRHNVPHPLAQSPIKLHQEEESNRSLIENIPNDVLLSFVAPYLKAKSIDALRCTCQQLHHCLRSVVPGLKLRLYRHQIKSLSWMRRREVRELVERDILKQQPHSECFDGGDVGGDLHRAVTGGATIRLAVRPGCQRRFCNGSQPEIRIDPLYGTQEKVDYLLQSLVSRKVARGGLLCDDPGLGKTITVLSLILQTFGLTTTRRMTPPEEYTGDDEDSSRSIQTGDKDVDEIFGAYWKEQMTPVFRRPELTKLLATLSRQNPTISHYFQYPVHPVKDGCPDYLTVVKRPICFADIAKRVTQSETYTANFDQFCADVELCFSNAILYNPEDHPVSQAARGMSEKFKELVTGFKARNVQSAKKSFSSASAKPNSSVASIIERRSKQKLIDNLVPSSATLLVVPSVLLPHWEEQLNLYLDTAYCTDKIPIIFHYKRETERNAQTAVDVMHLANMGTHRPLIFIDQTNTKRLPRPEFLAMFSIVVTTNQRLSYEWKHGSFSDELIAKDGGDSMGSVVRNAASACPFLKVRWLRLIVDEGHAMGRGTHNNAICFASWIEAERRWAMTGTPTPQTISQSGLHNIMGLMRFIQHRFFSARLDGDKVWQNCVARNWRVGGLAGFFHLKSLLLLLMVRHTKLDIEELKPPKFHQTLSVMSQEEITAYNTLVCAVQSNLILTAMEGKTSGKQDSLLHASQAKHARKAFSNVRLACSGGTRVVPTITQQFFDETLSLLHGVKAVKRRIVEDFMHRATTEQLSGCHYCGMQLSTLLVLPCGDLICTECMNSDTRHCPLCEEPFDVDEFQVLQPGLIYTWKWNLEEEKEKEKLKRQSPLTQANAGAMNRARGVQPGAINLEGLDADERQRVQEELAGVVPLQPAPVRRRTRRRGDGHVCEYDPAALDGKCTLCLEEHEDCIMWKRESKCHVCYRTPELCPAEESKFYYVTNKLERLVLNQKVPQSCAAASRLVGEAIVAKDIRPIKVIVFSQFRPILNLVGHRLLRRFGAGCVAEYWGYARKQELSKFTKSRDCFCMLLGKDGSEGLDLSFVTHIFFLDQVWDKSLEDQVVARAYRMGAKGHVEVETLVSKDSVEQTMAEIEASIKKKHHDGNVSMSQGDKQDSEGVQLLSSTSGSAKEYQRAKLHFLLKNLTLIKGHAFVENKKRKGLDLGRGASSSKTNPQETTDSNPKKRKTVRFNF